MCNRRGQTPRVGYFRSGYEKGWVGVDIEAEM